jgi:2-methoxy-6-polyprenyl-1,4-benzoquinol methylase
MLSKQLIRKLITSQARPLIVTSSRYFTTNTSAPQQEAKIDFGFKDINRDDKEKMVGKVFSSVAESYDVMNDAMSLGIHRCWKDTFVGMIGPMRMRKITDEKGQVIGEEPLKMLDVAGGTGDITFRIHEKAQKESVGSKCT